MNMNRISRIILVVGVVAFFLTVNCRQENTTKVAQTAPEKKPLLAQKTSDAILTANGSQENAPEQIVQKENPQEQSKDICKMLNFIKDDKELYGYYRNFGTQGGLFGILKPGEWEPAAEGFSVLIRTYNGQLWHVEFEADSNIIQKRRIYLLQVSSDKKKGCGAAMRDWEPVPSQCVVKEKVLSFQQAKKFLKGKISDHRMLFDESREVILKDTKEYQHCN